MERDRTFDYSAVTDLHVGDDSSEVDVDLSRVVGVVEDDGHLRYLDGRKGEEDTHIDPVAFGLLVAVFRTEVDGPQLEIDGGLGNEEGVLRGEGDPSLLEGGHHRLGVGFYFLDLRMGQV